MNFREFLLEEFDLHQRMERIFSNPTFQHHLQQPIQVPDLRTPSGDIQIPEMERSGKIMVLLAKKNPIYVKLSDGTEAHFTFDEYQRIQGTPALGKTMRIVLQRHGQDASSEASKIVQASVQD